MTSLPGQPAVQFLALVQPYASFRLRLSRVVLTQPLFSRLSAPSPCFYIRTAGYEPQPCEYLSKIIQYIHLQKMPYVHFSLDWVKIFMWHACFLLSRLLIIYWVHIEVEPQPLPYETITLGVCLLVRVIDEWIGFFSNWHSQFSSEENFDPHSSHQGPEKIKPTHEPTKMQTDCPMPWRYSVRRSARARGVLRLPGHCVLRT